MFAQFGEKFPHKRFDPNNLKKHVIWIPQSVRRLLRIENQTFLVFGKFGENLCNK